MTNSELRMQNSAASAPATAAANGTNENMILATNVHKTFRTGVVEVHALRGVSITVPRGEMVAIMGPSGCGKTTLLNCLSGLDDFDEGEVFIEGVNLRSMNDRRRTAYRAERMGFVFQTFNLLPVLTAVENVELPLLVAGVRSADARKRALEALASVDLSDRVQHRPSELSGGQRQRVTIARALVNNPAIVWADEPTGNLDSKASSDVLALMRRLNQERQQTFVIVTHDPGIGALCDRIVRMADGLIVDDDQNTDDQNTNDQNTDDQIAADSSATAVLERAGI